MAEAQVFNDLSTDALFAAIEAGDKTLALRWLNEGADPNGVRGEALNTPLIFCAIYRQPGIAAELLKRGAQPDYARKNHETALIMAARQGDQETSKVLVDAGANILLQDHANEDAMMIAVRSDGRLPFANLIREWRAAYEARTARDQREAHRRQNVADIVETLRTGSKVPVTALARFQLKARVHG
jgi:ankyrin repeat protein